MCDAHYTKYFLLRCAFKHNCKVLISEDLKILLKLTHWLSFLDLLNFQCQLVELIFYSRVNSPNSGCLPNTGYRPLYTMMRHFAAFSPIINWWAAWRPVVQLYNDGPICGPFLIINTLPEFSKFTLVEESLKLFIHEKWGKLYNEKK